MLLALMIGILSVRLVFVPTYIVIIVGIAIVSTTIYNFKKPSYRISLIIAPSLVLYFILFGNTLANIRLTQPLPQQHKEYYISGFIEDITGVTDKSIKTDIHADTIWVGDSIFYNQKGILYISKSASLYIKSGKKLHARVKAIEMKPPTNPGMFNYSAYLTNNGYSFTAFADSASVMWHNTYYWSIASMAAKARTFIMTVFSNSNIDGAYTGLLQSLFLGDKSDLDKDVKKAFMNSGTIHLLAVSGLHAGIIYMLISFILPKSKNKKWKLIRMFIVITLLWTYSITTGFAPSVQRAALMITVVEIGRTNNRNTSILNLLIISLLAILIIYPFSIYAAGMWLSFSAVAGIVYLYPIIYNIVSFRFPPFDWAWSLIAVSLAAQTGTIPFSLYFFHAFPSYFLLNNLIMVPLLAPVLMLSIVTLIISPLPFLSDISSGLLNDLLQFMEQYVVFSGTLPGSQISNITFDMADMVITLALLGLIYAMVHLKMIVTLRPILIIIIIFATKQIIYNQILSTKNEIVIFDTPRGIAISAVDNGFASIIYTNDITEDALAYSLSGYITKSGIKTYKTVEVDPPAIITCSNTQIAIISGYKKEYDEFINETASDIVVISGNHNPSETVLPAKDGTVVLSNSIMRKYRELWIDYIDKNDTIRCWNINKLGALKVNIESNKKINIDF